MQTLWVSTALSLALAACWAFPWFWYGSSSFKPGSIWLGERKSVDGWQFTGVPVSRAVERLLVADRIVCGEFTRQSREAVRVFSAKRYTDSQNDAGLFVHTPDRCWTEAGWQIEVPEPDCVEVPMFGRRLLFERRVFVVSGQRELVYFGGMVGGEPLPYRLDHNLSVGMRYARQKSEASSGSALRASDPRFWKRVWDSFASRRPLFGPKQFIRLSTPITTGGLAEGDARLRSFASHWLERADYEAEFREWRAAKH
jgi:hypothetical protein